MRVSPGSRRCFLQWVGGGPGGLSTLWQSVVCLHTYVFIHRLVYKYEFHKGQGPGCLQEDKHPHEANRREDREGCGGRGGRGSVSGPSGFGDVLRERGGTCRGPHGRAGWWQEWSCTCPVCAAGRLGTQGLHPGTSSLVCSTVRWLVPAWCRCRVAQCPEGKDHSLDRFPEGHRSRSIASWRDKSHGSGHRDVHQQEGRIELCFPSPQSPVWPGGLLWDNKM